MVVCEWFEHSSFFFFPKILFSFFCRCWRWDEATDNRHWFTFGHFTERSWYSLIEEIQFPFIQPRCCLGSNVQIPGCKTSRYQQRKTSQVWLVMGSVMVPFMGSGMGSARGVIWIMGLGPGVLSFGCKYPKRRLLSKFKSFQNVKKVWSTVTFTKVEERPLAPIDWKSWIFWVSFKDLPELATGWLVSLVHSCLVRHHQHSYHQHSHHHHGHHHNGMGIGKG